MNHFSHQHISRRTMIKAGSIGTLGALLKSGRTSEGTGIQYKR